MSIHCIWEHNGSDTLLYAADYPGAFARGASVEEAMAKIPLEVRSWCLWAGWDAPEEIVCEVIQEKESSLMIRDADSDVLFDSEREPLTAEEYKRLKTLALGSACDFHQLYEAVPDHHQSCLKPRKTFYSQIPRTAQEMYEHTRCVNSYYFGEIGVECDSEGSILECRERGFGFLENQPDFLNSIVFDGSYGEQWSLRKVLRRFIWHDRIHARAMLRMAKRNFPGVTVPDPFHLEL